MFGSPLADFFVVLMEGRGGDLVGYGWGEEEWKVHRLCLAQCGGREGSIPGDTFSFLFFGGYEVD